MVNKLYKSSSAVLPRHPSWGVFQMIFEILHIGHADSIWEVLEHWFVIRAITDKNKLLSLFAQFEAQL